jgi:hypothetical protein
MEESKITTKGKAKKSIAKKKADTLNVISTNGLNLILDNSLSKYANDKFFIEHAKKVDQKFAPNKSQS